MSTFRGTTPPPPAFFQAQMPRSTNGVPSSIYSLLLTLSLLLSLISLLSTLAFFLLVAYQLYSLRRYYVYVYYMPRLIWMVVTRSVKENARGLFVNRYGNWRKGRLVTLGVVILVAGFWLEWWVRRRLRREWRSDEESTLWVLRTAQVDEVKKAR